jgi:2-deoxy-D-gluconate 3-dehydrogenase
MAKSPSPFDLSGRIAVVTGGNGGIGRAIAFGLARAGASVTLLARNENKNAGMVKELETLGVPAIALRVDVTQRATLESAIAEVERRLGGLDILVNNAGVAHITGGVLNETIESWDTVVETHLNATFLLSKLAAASMVKPLWKCS